MIPPVPCEVIPPLTGEEAETHRALQLLAPQASSDTRGNKTHRVPLFLGPDLCKIIIPPPTAQVCEMPPLLNRGTAKFEVSITQVCTFLGFDCS